ASTAGMLRAFATSVLAIPLTYVCAGLIFLGLRGTDEWAMWILESGEDGTTGDDVGIGAILRLFGLWVNPDKNDGAGGIAVDANSEIWAMGQSGQPGMIVGPFIVAIIMLLACLVLMLMMLPHGRDTAHGYVHSRSRVLPGHGRSEGDRCEVGRHGRGSPNG